MNSSMMDFLAAQDRTRRERGIVRATRIRSGALDLASNDYLGLSRDPRVLAAAHAALDTHGAGARASRVVTGTSAAHEELEAELCALTGQPSALGFASGYAANLGVIAALGGPDLLLVLDAHIHASVHDAAKLARCEVQFVPHGDVDAVRDALRHRSLPRALVVVESIYSVLGDAADVVALARVCAESDAVLLVDEAHGLGVIGGGRGGVHAAGLAGADHVYLTATMSKALGTQGGAVLGPVELREHLVNRARSFIFDTGVTPAAAAGAAEACRIIAAEPERVDQLAANADAIARVCGIPRAAGPVQSIPCPSAEVARVTTERVGERGVLVGCFRPPSVPDGISRIRITANGALTLDAATAAATLVRAEFDAVCATEPNLDEGGAVRATEPHAAAGGAAETVVAETVEAHRAAPAQTTAAAGGGPA